MKWLLSIILLFPFLNNPSLEKNVLKKTFSSLHKKSFFDNFGQKIDLSEEIRKLYPNANSSEANASVFASKLKEVSEKDAAILLAYKGASIIMVSKFEKKLSNKISRLKEGAKWIEKAVASDPKNVEIRLVRLSIQENLPNIVHYKKNKTEDKNFIFLHYKEGTGSLSTYIKNFILQSKSFSNEEKQAIK
jgi:hypothetical protein